MTAPKQPARRASFIVVFGEGDARWSCPDPAHPVVVKANRAARGFGGRGNPLVLADVVSAFADLVYDCPSTKLACEKLAALRRAVRDMPIEGDD